MSERSAYEPAKTPRPRQSTPPPNWEVASQCGAVARAYHLAVVEKLEARIAELEAAILELVAGWDDDAGPNHPIRRLASLVEVRDE